MLRYLVGSNAVAPLDTIPLNNVLDLGTGTGIWVLEMAHDYPDTAFVGVDINTVNQPSTVIPSNASFMQADILKGLPFPNESFDYIHARLLAGGIPRESWRNALVEYQRLLRPGGFLELIEPDMVIRNPGAVGMQLANVVPEFLRESYRMDFTIFPDTFTRMIETGGFSPVNMVPLEAPLGKWAGMAGDMMLRNYMGVIGMFKGPMTRAGLVESEAWVDAQLQEWIGEVNRNHSFTHYYYYVARKPQHVTKE
jgi:SAM-dependent methyltransferase